MQGRSVNPLSCSGCGQAPRGAGRFCFHCGTRIGRVAFQAEPELPRYRKRTRRAVAVVRCGGFHHELLLNVFHYRFCPECGVSLCRPHAGPEPA